MVRLIFSLTILILGLLQVTLLDSVSFFLVKPDLLLISALTASLTLNFKTAFILSVLAGLFKDTFSANSFGINTLLFALWSFVIAKLSQKVSLDYDYIRIALIFIIAVIHNIFTAILFIYLKESIPLGLVLRIVIIGSIYTAIVFPLILKLNKVILIYKHD
jgi:rod shape-determining protein MreD